MLAQQTQSGAGLVVLFLPLVIVAVMIVGWWQIATKAGYPGAWALIALVPIANLVVFFVFAFGDWPVLKKLRARESAGPPPAPPLM